MRLDDPCRWYRPIRKRAAAARRDAPPPAEAGRAPQAAGLTDPDALTVCVASSSHGWPFFWGHQSVPPAAASAALEPKASRRPRSNEKKQP